MTVLNPVTLQYLPNELLKEIGCQSLLLNPAQNGKIPLCNLRLVCQQFDVAIQPLLFSEVRIKFGRRDIRQTMLKLQSILAGSTRAFNSAKTLSIEFGDPYADDDSSLLWLQPYMDWNMEEGESICDDDKDVLMEDQAELDLIHVTESVEWLRENLSLAIASLSNVTSCKWDLGGCISYGTGTPRWLAISILRGLAFLPTLEEFTWYIYGVSIPSLPLEWLSNLRKLEIISTSLSNASHGLVQQVGRMVASNPGLRHLHVRIKSEGLTSTLDDLFQSTSPSNSLQHLGMDGLGITGKMLARYAPQHMKNLSSLEVRNSFIRPFDAGETMEDFYSDQRLLDRNGIWRSLQREDIHISRLKVDVICAGSALSDYLDSYSGAQSLLFVSDQEEFPKPEPVPDYFFRRVFERHSITLTEIFLGPDCVSAWFNKDQRICPLLQCQNLNTLGVALFPDFSLSLVHSLLDTIINLSKLKEARIHSYYPAPTRSSSNVQCVKGVRQFFCRAREEIIDSMETFRGKGHPACTSLQIIACRLRFSVIPGKVHGTYQLLPLNNCHTFGQEPSINDEGLDTWWW
ncbi:hypothetical protein BDQ12DRAFT_739987 [Crucibulum laeve]|uniref:Uncharacterized protein n=1 Tax=Crucibulum laeve TaxID=68775 RepID=A0A5C3LH18_9AGAR|nr:hypothetical protein BDQ12DRAFT_739987 [Crucibulum laeve]